MNPMGIGSRFTHSYAAAKLAFYNFEDATISSATSVNEKCMGKWELVADLPWLMVKIPQLNRLILEHWCAFPNSRNL